MMAVKFAKLIDIRSLSLLPRELAVGWSGGADSTALLLALKELGYDVQAWHVDHGWRASSQEETRQLAAWSEGWGIPFHAARLQGDCDSNREAEARRGRFDQFLAWRRQLGVTTLCLGHHRDDQAETVCMRMLQGAGAIGCRGMRRERDFHGLHIVRPLLHVSGSELREMLRQAGIPWLEDPSNLDLSIWRNRIRHSLFPAIEAVGVMPDQLFMRWQKQAERIAGLLDADAGRVLEDVVVAKAPVEDGSVSLSWRAWAGCTPAVRARVLQRLMVAALGEGATPGRRHIVMVEEWTGRSGRGGLDLSRCRLQRRQGGLHLLPR